MCVPQELWVTPLKDSYACDCCFCMPFLWHSGSDCMWCALGLVCKVTTAPEASETRRDSKTYGILGWANLSNILLFLFPHLPSSSSFPKIINKFFFLKLWLKIHSVKIAVKCLAALLCRNHHQSISRTFSSSPMKLPSTKHQLLSPHHSSLCVWLGLLWLSHKLKSPSAVFDGIED